MAARATSGRPRSRMSRSIGIGCGGSWKVRCRWWLGSPPVRGPSWSALRVRRRLGGPGQAVDAGPERLGSVRQPHLLEAVALEPAADHRDQVGRFAVPGPDHGAAGLAQLAAEADGGLDVGIADIAET